MFAALDLCFNLLCERALLGGGARVLWLARGGAVPIEEHMQATRPALVAGALLWTVIAGALWAWLS